MGPHVDHNGRSVLQSCLAGRKLQDGDLWARTDVSIESPAAAWWTTQDRLAVDQLTPSLEMQLQSQPQPGFRLKMESCQEGERHVEAVLPAANISRRSA